MLIQQYNCSINEHVYPQPLLQVLLLYCTWCVLGWVGRLLVGVSSCVAINGHFFLYPRFSQFFCTTVGMHAPVFFVPVRRSILDVKSLGEI